ncbi:MAG: hypothetical protein WCP39_01690, partial [Chlamydiota bacterium]
MKKLLCCALCCFSGLSSLYAEPSSSESSDTKETLFYGNIGVGPIPFLVPSFGIGYRTQTNHWGGDFVLDLSTVGYLTFIK